ncbi:SDR family oxidoreductase [Cylindrospermopsis raciborskii UAM/DH-MRr]|uniref:SDR family oxidoreductase n=1 Tax=Cylindrospermopsis raciborskii TaxID=77022 RepID=UPI003878FBCA
MRSIETLIQMRSRVVLITGAGGGLGKVMADTLAELGANLILVDRPECNLEILGEYIRTHWGVNVLSISCDLESEASRIELIRQVYQSGQGLNCLINNAAFVGSSDLTGWVVPFEEQTLETWRRALEVNLTAAFHTCQGLAPLLRSAPGGNIINIASIYGHHGPDWDLYEGTTMGNPAAYGASKGGLIQLTRWLATTLAPDVRVNAISPGGIYRNQPQVFVERYNQRTPLGRMATEDDFRGVVGFLASDLSSYVTGQILQVDGGWSVW